jgi:hypothetical protein
MDFRLNHYMTSNVDNIVLGQVINPEFGRYTGRPTLHMFDEGLFSMSAVKTAHTWFPMAYLEQQQTTQNALHARNPKEHLRGSWAALTTQYNVNATSRFAAHAVGWHEKS